MPSTRPSDRNSGGFWPFWDTKANRLAAGDPRPSLEERYGTAAGYNCVVTNAINTAVRSEQRRLLAVLGYQGEPPGGGRSASIAGGALWHGGRLQLRGDQCHQHGRQIGTAAAFGRSGIPRRTAWRREIRVHRWRSAMARRPVTIAW